MYSQTTAYQKIASLNKRIRVIQGGTSAGKTIAILLYLISAAQTQKVSISIVSESIPHLKRGVMRDFLNIMQSHNYFNPGEWNISDRTYTFSNGSYIEFFSADDPTKMRGSRRDILFINECNNVAHSAYEQLEVRTRLLVILDFNPVSEFWVHTEIIPKMEHDFIILTYKDNEALEPEIIASIESRRDNENWYRVYGLGQVGINEGQIFTNWEIIPGINDDMRLLRRGLDFGYTVDPSAGIAIYTHDNALILDEELYQKGLSNADISNILKGLPEPQTLIVGDSAEPKSISEIKSYGLRITGAVKGPGSINYGIQLMQDQQIKVTQRSVNLIKEYRNYLWKVDRDGTTLNVPIDIWNHGIDAARYAIADIKGKRVTKVYQEKPSIF